MKKTLIALAVLGAAAGVAHAQSNVTVYGVVDTGFVKESQNSWRMDENTNNRIGFRGQEDLGNGLKATFELEKRFYLNNGAAKGGKDAKGTETLDWDGAANVGLAGANWGRVRFGRMNELPTEYYRKLDPFNQDGVGASIYSSVRSARISNTVRYDSPSWSGFSFGATYSLGNNDGSYTDGILTSAQKSVLNDGYAVSLNYANGPILGTANWSRLADSNDSYNWNIGGGYTFAGVARVTLGYEYTKDKRTAANAAYDAKANAGGGWTPYSSTDAWQVLGGTKQNNWLLGLQWALGPGKLNAAYNYSKVERADGKWAAGTDTDVKLQKFAIGYTYDLSKRTAVYGNIAYTSYDTEAAGLKLYGLQNKDNNTAYQVGMTHKF